MPWPRLADSQASAGRRDSTLRARRAKANRGRSRTPKASYQRSSAGWYSARPSRQPWSGLRRRPHSTVPPPRSSRILRIAIPPAASTATASTAARIQTAPSSSAAATQPSEPALSGLVAGSPELSPEVTDVRALLVARAGRFQRLVQGRLRRGAVNAAAELGLAGQDRYPVIGHGQEAAADRAGKLTAGRLVPLRQDPDDAARREYAEHGGVTGKDADIAVQGLGDHPLGIAGPDLSLRSDDLYPQRHGVTSRDPGTTTAPPAAVTAAPAPWPSSPRPRFRRT